jgi:hypothetical protein
MAVIFSPGWRKFVLTAHLVFSVGWIGAVIAFLVLVVAAMNSQDDQLVLAAGASMELIGQFAIVPMALLSFITGLIMALFTKWGLFKQYWVIFSLVLTLFAVIVLWQHFEPLNYFSGVTEAHHATAVDEVARIRAGLPSELLHAGLGLLVLLVVQALNTYKPKGETPWGG